MLSAFSSIKQNAALSGFRNTIIELAVLVQNRVFHTLVDVLKDIARAKNIQDLAGRHRNVGAVDLHWAADFLRDCHRRLQRLNSKTLRQFLALTDFQTQDIVLVLVVNPGNFLRVEVFGVDVLMVTGRR